MSDTIKTFGLWVSKIGKADAVPWTPHVKIVLNQWSDVGDGIPAVTPQLVNESEVDAYIQALKADLDAVGRRAKAAIRQARQETAAIAGSRNSN